VLSNSTSETIQHADGRVELRPEAAVEIKSSPLYNHDLAPVPIERRNWSTYNYAALWISMAHCIPTYMMSSGLISAGMNWWQALITILLGNTIVLVPILLNSHPGTKYGIPFPVFARAAYGTYGSNLPALMRAIVACGWFGIQAWIGGEALNTFFAAIIPNWKGLLGGPIGGHAPTEWLSFLLFWCLNIFIIFRGMDLLRKVENWAAPFVLVMTTLLLTWAIWKAHGLGEILSKPGSFGTWSAFRPVFFLKLTAMVGFWATLSLNMPDFTRYGRSQREQVVGQVAALPTTMTVFAAMGVMITSAAAVIYHDLPADQLKDLWDPMKLVSHFGQVWVIVISMFTVIVATLAVNIAANVVSPANDFANAFPKVISFRLGGLITGIIGILMQPWRLLQNSARYIDGWLVGYSGGMGAIAGVLIVDYWLVRRKSLALGDLYRVKGTYTYNGGWNWRAVAATLVGCAFAWIGLVVPLLRPLYDYAWFVGFGAAAITHLALMNLAPPKSQTLTNGEPT
jgi:NCS1 family nucleobase:cation symporter-1